MFSLLWLIFFIIALVLFIVAVFCYEYGTRKSDKSNTKSWQIAALVLVILAVVFLIVSIFTYIFRNRGVEAPEYFKEKGKKFTQWKEKKVKEVKNYFGKGENEEKGLEKYSPTEKEVLFLEEERPRTRFNLNEGLERTRVERADVGNISPSSIGGDDGDFF